MNSLALISVMRGSLYANWFFGLVNYILLPILVVISAYTNKKGSQFYVRSIRIQITAIALLALTILVWYIKKN